MVITKQEVVMVVMSEDVRKRISETLKRKYASELKVPEKSEEGRKRISEM